MPAWIGLTDQTSTPTSTGGSIWWYGDSTASSTATTSSTTFVTSIASTTYDALDLQRQFLAEATNAHQARRLRAALYLGNVMRDAQDAQLAAEYQRMQERPVPPPVPAQLAVPPTAAAMRARDLLLASLTPVQRKTFIENHGFVVEGQSRHRYKIHTRMGISGNIERLDSAGTPIHRLCAHAPVGMGLPHEDHLLAQKLHLEFAEEDFLRVANVHARW